MNSKKQNKNRIFHLSGSTLRGIERKVTFLLACITISFSAIAQREPVKVDDGYKVEIKTSGICEMCQYTLEKDLAFEKGVKTALFNLDDKMMTVVYNPKKTNAQTLRKRITMIGYHADTLARNPIAYNKLPMCCKDGSHGTPIPQVPLKTKEDN